MKHLFILMVVLGIVNYSTAQTFSEWFRQEQTQKKYLIEQIAALQVYVDYIEKGYDITRKGLGVISSLKKGDLNLHAGYFKSLKSISPAVRQYAKIPGIIRLQLEILSLHKSATRQIKQSSQFTAGELAYIGQVYNNLLNQSTTIINDLVILTTAGNTAMKDDERIKRIDTMYTGMQNLHAFTQSFFTDAQGLAIQRQKEQNDLKTSRLMYGIK